MPRTIPFRPLATALLSVAVAVSLATALRADNNGRTGKTQSPQGCNCHGTLNTPGVTVTITGPQSVRPSTTNTYTISVAGGPSGTNGGVDLRPTAGTLVAGANSKVSNGELVHANPNVRSWTFQWTSPATLGAQSFHAVGFTGDGNDGTSGDAWNWYGGVVSTPFTIQVTDQLGVGDEPVATWLAPVAPNPLVARGTVTFSVATAGEVRLDAFDAAGRRVATLAEGSRAAGRHAVEWRGCDDTGTPLRGGLYFLRLRAGGAEHATRALILR